MAVSKARIVRVLLNIFDEKTLSFVHSSGGRYSLSVALLCPTELIKGDLLMVLVCMHDLEGDFLAS
jgi:hypothetical protein